MISTAEFLSEWQWARQLSVSILETIPDDVLTTPPVPSTGPWWKHFRHLGRVQENYIEAIQTGRVTFTPEHGTYSGGADRQTLLTYLQETDRKLTDILSGSGTLPEQIDWFGTPASLQLHLVRLLSHETLHHGQFIIYARQTGFKLPQGWEAWGE